MPIASRPAQMKRPSANAQMKDVTPGSMLGGRRCIGRDRNASAVSPGSPKLPTLVRVAARPSVPDQKNSPSRFRFRPPLPLTFPFRVLPSDSVSTYLRSVLGAITTLTCQANRSRDRKRACPQFAEFLFSPFPQPFFQHVETPVERNH